MAIAIACASGSTPAAAPEASASTTLTDIKVDSGADNTIVTLVGAADRRHDAFQESDPARVVVDLPGVSPGSVASPIAVSDGVVNDVAVKPWVDASGMAGTRVEISLASVSTYEIRDGAEGPAIWVTRTDRRESLGAADTMSTEVVHDDPWAAPAMAAPSMEGSEAAGAMASASAPEAAPMAASAVEAAPATKLLGVDAQDDNGAVSVVLHADGTISNAKQFEMKDPLRMVIDLPGIANAVKANRVKGDGALVSRVRLGQHDDKVRIVIDAAEGVSSFGDTHVTPVADGLCVGLNGASSPMPSVAAAAPAAMPETAPAPEASAEPAPAPAEPVAAMSEPMASGTQVTGVSFAPVDGMERVTVDVTGPIDYSALHPDGKTLVLQVRNAKLAAETYSVVPEKPGSVSLVSAFEQPKQGEPEVRVLVQHVPGVEAKISEDAGHVYLDYPVTASTAAALPMNQAPAQTAAMATTAGAAAAPAPPAAMDPSESAVDVLQEGGLTNGKVYSGRRVSMDFKNVDIDDVLRLIAEVSDLNVIAGDEVKGEVTIRLVDVPWDQALDVILLTKGLGFVRVGNVLRIAPADTLKLEDEARLQERRAKEKLEDLVVKLQPVNYANVKEVAAMVKRLLTSRGTVDLDLRTNTVILKDIASVVEEATALIKAIDTQTPQVLIEAKIVEARLDFLRELGSTWALGIQPNVDAFDASSGKRTNENIGDAVTFGTAGSNTTNNIAVANPITELATGVVNLGAFLLDDRFNVDVQLQAAESKGDGKVISSPRVVTLDNRKASIEQGVSIPFQTFENGDAKLEFVDAVLRLDVTPHITADRSIIMKLEVSNNRPDDSVPTPTGSPAIAKNEAQTETLVKDGQTLVIGGIYVTTESQSESRVPYFHRIPLIGNAFKNKQVRDQRQELLVFVTPRVVVTPESGT